MTEPADNPARPSAGALLRAARERQGLHIAALAAAIKVSPRKLDALENDRYAELPDATFTRALAQTVCRSLKIDPQPVLALLPQADAGGLDHVGGTLNEPFRDRPGRADPAGVAVAAIRPMVWAGGALLLAAALVYVLPSSLWQPAPAAVPPLASAPAGAAEAVPAVAAPASAVETADAAGSAPAAVVAPVETPGAAPGVAQAAEPAARAASASVASAVPASAPASAAPAAPRLVELQTQDASWIEARDARGQMLLSRLVQPGERVGFDGAVPIRLTIGNAPGTRLVFRGKPVDLAASTRDNVARLELQ